MNYYERHIGDYIRDTVGLSMLEDGAYGRLLDQLYQTEKPLPLDRKEVYRMARATNAPERKAVDYVVGKFFEKTDDGFVQKRAMEILAEYWDRPEQPDKKNTKEGNRERQRKSRERRKALFEALAGHGVVPPYNTAIRDLEAMLSRYLSQKKCDTSQPVTDSVMAPVMGNHSPPPTTQIKPSVSSEVVVDLRVTASNADHIPTTALDWVRFFADEHGIQTDTYSAKGREKFWPLAQGWIDAKISIGKMREACAKAKEDAGEPIMYLPSYVNSVLINAQSRAAQPPKQKQLHRMTDLELEVEAQRVKAHTQGCSRDQVIERINAKRKQLEGVAA